MQVDNDVQTKDFEVLRNHIYVHFNEATRTRLVFETDIQIDPHFIPENIRACKQCLRFVKRYALLAFLEDTRTWVVKTQEANNKKEYVFTFAFALLEDTQTWDAKAECAQNNKEYPVLERKVAGGETKSASDLAVITSAWFSGARCPVFQSEEYSTFANHIRALVARSRIIRVFCVEWGILGAPQTAPQWNHLAMKLHDQAPSRCLYRKHTFALVHRAHKASHSWSLWTWELILSQLENAKWECLFSPIDFVKAVIASYQTTNEALLQFVLSLSENQLVCFRGFLGDLSSFVCNVRKQKPIRRSQYADCFQWMDVWDLKPVDHLLYVESDGGGKFYVWPVAYAPASFQNRAPLAWSHRVPCIGKRMGFVVRMDQVKTMQ